MTPYRGLTWTSCLSGNRSDSQGYVVSSSLNLYLDVISFLDVCVFSNVGGNSNGFT